MAWTRTTQNGRTVATETLTFTQDQATDLASSAITWIPKGADFTVIATVSACLSAAADIAVWACDSESGTYALLLDNFIATGTWDVGATKVAAIYDNSLKGDSPYFKLYVDPSGAQDGDSVYLTVIS